MSGPPPRPPMFDADAIAGWHQYLDEVDRKIVAHGVERGFSRDALLVALQLNAMKNQLIALTDAVCLLAGEEPDDGEAPSWAE